VSYEDFIESIEIFTFSKSLSIWIETCSEGSREEKVRCWITWPFVLSEPKLLSSTTSFSSVCVSISTFYGAAGADGSPEINPKADVVD